MTKPYVTCILPMTNQPQSLRQAISFFLDQDYRPIELIVVDDGCKSYDFLAPATPQIRYYHTPPMPTGVMKRKFAIEQAKGELITHWEADCFYAFDWVSRSVQQLLASGADLVGLNNYVFYSAAHDGHFIDQLKHQDDQWLYGPTMTYKKSLWSNQGLTDQQSDEELDFLYAAAAKIERLNYLDGFIAQRR